MKKHRTNIDFIRDGMNYSDFGALAQVFLLQALTEYSKTVANASVEELDSPMISGKAWQGVAKEWQRKLEEFYNGNE